MPIRFLALAIGGALVAATASAISAQELAPARSPMDEAAIDRAWSQTWDDGVHSEVPLPFVPPDPADIPDDAFGELVHDGMRAFMSPSIFATDYVGNELACSSCHLDAGRRPGAAPMWGAYPVYPKFRGKNQQVNTIEMRVQGCFRYSMNGTPPPADGELMKSYLAYFAWLSQGAPLGAMLAGAGFDTLPKPEQKPDIERGAAVYVEYCVACHGADGAGLHEAHSPGWVFPPLWGPDSYNWGAGMQAPDKAAAFIKRNMPFGLQNLLTDQQAWDVAVYINSHERPQDPRFSGDVAATAAAFHKTPFNLYGTEVDGVVLGANAPPSGRGRFARTVGE